MRKSEILECWMSRYGPLSDASKQRFLRRQEAARLTRYPDTIVRQAIGWSNLLADALRFAASAYEGEPRQLPPEPSAPARSVSANSAVPLRGRGGRTRQVIDRDLANRIGPVQSYEDAF